MNDHDINNELLNDVRNEPASRATQCPCGRPVGLESYPFCSRCRQEINRQRQAAVAERRMGA